MLPLYFSLLPDKVVWRTDFMGKYYKFLSNDGFSFTLIVSYSNEGDMLQVITSNKSYYIKDTRSVDITGNNITFAIASIPLFGFIHFTGLLCFIKSEDKEYWLCTYNFAKIQKISDKEIIIKKGKYSLSLSINIKDGQLLQAPEKGNMIRYIKENLNVLTSYTFTYKDNVLYKVEDPLSSLEYIWF